MLEKDVWDLSLHEQLCIHDCVDVIRVPGGWVYRFHKAAANESCVFVPYVKKREI